MIYLNPVCEPVTVRISVFHCEKYISSGNHITLRDSLDFYGKASFILLLCKESSQKASFILLHESRLLVSRHSFSWQFTSSLELSKKEKVTKLSWFSIFFLSRIAPALVKSKTVLSTGNLAQGTQTMSQASLRKHEQMLGSTQAALISHRTLFRKAITRTFEDHCYASKWTFAQLGQGLCLSKC